MRRNQPRAIRSRRNALGNRIFRVEALESRYLLAVITVDSPADVVADDGIITLREAVAAANEDRIADALEGQQAGSGVDTIRFAPELSGTSIVLTNGELRITDDVTIEGPGRDDLSISGGNLSRIFNIDDGGEGRIDIRLAHLTLLAGSASGHGGAVYSRENLAVDGLLIASSTAAGSGGGLFLDSMAIATIRESFFEDNSAVEGGGLFVSQFGAGRFPVGGQLTVESSVFENNHAVTDGGGFKVTGNAGSYTFTGVEATNNSAETGGGGYLDLANDQMGAITDSVFVANEASGLGGGLYATGRTSRLEIVGGEFSRNRADSGGGIYMRRQGHITGTSVTQNVAERNGGGLHVAEPTMSNLEIDGNRAGLGGGIYFRDFNSIVNQPQLTTSTISNNSALQGGGLYAYDTDLEMSQVTVSGNAALGRVNSSGGGLHFFGGDSTIRHSTITNNFAPDAHRTAGGISARPDRFSSGRVTLDHSIVAGNHGSTREIELDFSFDLEIEFSLIGSGFGNVIGRDAMLEPLHNNGGSLKTHKPRSISPAINAGDPDFGEELANDQRGTGFARVQDGHIDIGALETPPVNRFIVDTAVDENDGDVGLGDLSLREALALADAEPGPSVITFADPFPSSIVLSNGELQIDSEVAIEGPGSNQLTIDAGGSSRVFFIDSSEHQADVSMYGITLTGGLADEGNGDEGSGGGIWSSGPLLLRDVAINNSSATGNGGGIYSRGELRVYESDIHGNTAADGGGIYSDAAVTLNDSSIFDNSASQDGGGLRLALINSTDAIILRSAVYDNTAGRNGGGFAIEDGNGAADLTNATVSGNSADAQGGGVYFAVKNALGLQIKHSTISDNDADIGGGLFAADDVVLDNTILAGNAANGPETVDVGRSLDASVDASFSLVGIGNGAGLSAALPDTSGNLIGATDTGPVDAQLAPLAENGGETKTHRLLINSPAVNAGTPVGNHQVYSDQRGHPNARVSDERMDIGSFERQQIPSYTTDLVVTSLIDERNGDFSEQDLSLREALDIANQRPTDDVIEFSAELAGGELRLNHGELWVKDAVRISGLRDDVITIDAVGQSRVFMVDDGDPDQSDYSSISSLRLVNGRSDDDGGAVHTQESLNLSSVVIADSTSGGHGGGLYASGNITVSFWDSEVVRNQTTGDARHGGGIATESGVTLRINATTVAANVSAGSGGGVYASENSELFVQGTVRDNEAGLDGGGMFAASGNTMLFDIQNSSLLDNIAGGNGGGLYFDNNKSHAGPRTIRDTSAAGNTAENGGGLWLLDDGEDTEIANFEATTNVARNNGGGLWLLRTGEGQTSVSGARIVDNTSVTGGGAYIENDSAAANILFSEALLQENQADGGGGMFLTGHNIEVAAVTFASNTSAGDGGGLSIGADGGEITIANSTVSNNVSTRYGGGLFASGASGSLTLAHNTITQNSAGQDGVPGEGGGIYADDQVDFRVENTIVAQNMADAGSDIIVSESTSFTSAYNIIGDNRGTPLAEANPDDAGNQVGGPISGTIDARLGPLADNGGFAVTHVPLLGSPAIDTGDPNFTAPPFADQRGRQRNIRRLDIGSIEVGVGVDFNGDGSVNCQDIDSLSIQIASGDFSARFDLNSDDELNIDDISSWLVQAGMATIGVPFLYGDATLDGSVDAQDLGTVGINWQSQRTGFCQGDFDADGFVRASDLNLLGQNWQKGRFAAAAMAVAHDRVRPPRTPRTSFPTNAHRFAAPRDAGVYSADFAASPAAEPNELSTRELRRHIFDTSAPQKRVLAADEHVIAPADADHFFASTEKRSLLGHLNHRLVNRINRF